VVHAQASILPGLTAILAHNGLAQTTRDGTDAAWRWWTRFCACTDSDPISFHGEEAEAMLSFFLAFCFPKLAYSSVKTYMASITRRLRDLGRPINVSSMHLYQRVLRGYKRAKPPRSRARLPITPLLLHDIRRRNSQPTSVCDTIRWALVVIGVYGLFRLGELTATRHARSRIRVADVKFVSSSHATIFLSHSKTDHFRRGVEVHLFANSSLSCPLRQLKRVAQWHVTKGHAHNTPFFCDISGAAFTDGDMRKFIKKKVASIGLDESKFSGHSLRKGGAQALHNAGVSIYDIKTAGRWRSWCVERYLSTPLNKIKNHSYAMSRAPQSTSLVNIDA
jgi:hypothetical protein